MQRVLRTNRFESQLVEPSAALRSLVHQEHNAIEASQSSPWIADAEERYRNRTLPSDVRGEENQEAWAHIQRHLALENDQFRVHMIPNHWLPILTHESLPDLMKARVKSTAKQRADAWRRLELASQRRREARDTFYNASSDNAYYIAIMRYLKA